jgi:hypothetical protein
MLKIVVKGAFLFPLIIWYFNLLYLKKLVENEICTLTQELVQNTRHLNKIIKKGLILKISEVVMYLNILSSFKQAN